MALAHLRSKSGDLWLLWTLQPGKASCGPQLTTPWAGTKWRFPKFIEIRGGYFKSLSLFPILLNLLNLTNFLDDNLGRHPYGFMQWLGLTCQSVSKCCLPLGWTLVHPRVGPKLFNLNWGRTCKARGSMCRYIVTKRIKDPAGLKKFTGALAPCPHGQMAL